jgi:hypothetical protein
MLKQAPSGRQPARRYGYALFIVSGRRVIEESRPPLARTTVEAVQGALVAIERGRIPRYAARLKPRNRTGLLGSRPGSDVLSNHQVSIT